MSQSISIGVDNDGAIIMENSAVIYDTSKHFGVIYPFIREAVKNSYISLRRELSKTKLADPQTKLLDRTLHERLTEAHGVRVFAKRA